MSPQGQEACKPKSQIRPGSKNTYRQDKRITGAAKLNLAAWLEEFGWLKWNDPVGVQAATIKPDLTTSLRAAWTSTSTIVANPRHPHNTLWINHVAGVLLEVQSPRKCVISLKLRWGL